MTDRSKIQWTDATWNPVRGCSKVSPGCANCYAERQLARFSGPGGYAEGFVRDGRWTGRVELVEDKLLAPLRWRRPRRVFVNSTSDLFHEGLDDRAIARVFEVMARCLQHDFQVLTKRPERMRDWVTRHVEALGDRRPLENVWLGVSAEDQRTADERIPVLLDTPASMRFVSAEPLLGPVDLSLWTRDAACSALQVDWVIVGGESGPRARPCDVAWVRRIVRDCRGGDVPVFVKQLGACPLDDGRVKVEGQRFLLDRKGGDPGEWPEDLRVREFPISL